MKIFITGLDKWKNEKHKTFIYNVCSKTEQVLAWEKWQMAIETGSYIQNRGCSGEQIKNMILTGADDKGRTPDGDIDLNCWEFRRLSNVIAYTYLGDVRTFFNTYILDQRLKQGLKGEGYFAGTILHELMHRAFNFTHKWPYPHTVPYKVGNITSAKYIEYWQNEGKSLNLFENKPVEFHYKA